MQDLNPEIAARLAGGKCLDCAVSMISALAFAACPPAGLIGALGSFAVGSSILLSCLDCIESLGC
jgi:hypothetical protein